MREHALTRVGLPHTLTSTEPLTMLPLHEWSLLHAPLPVGFQAVAALAADADAAPPVAAAADDARTTALLAAKEAKEADAAAGAEHASADAKKAAKKRAAATKRASKDAAAAAAAAAREREGPLCEAMAASLASRLRAAEPTRWAALEERALVAELNLIEAARRFVQHHADVLTTQSEMYLRATYEAPASAEGQRSFTNGLMRSMDVLDAHAASLVSWGAGEAPAVKPAGFGVGGGSGAMGSAGMGGAKGAGATKPKKKAGGKKRR